MRGMEVCAKQMTYFNRKPSVWKERLEWWHKVTGPGGGHGRVSPGLRNMTHANTPTLPPPGTTWVTLTCASHLPPKAQHPHLYNRLEIVSTWIMGYENQIHHMCNHSITSARMNIIINLSLLFSYGVTIRFSTAVPQCKEHLVQVLKEELLPEHSQPWEPVLALRGARKRVSWETGPQQGWMCPLISWAWCSCGAADALTQQDPFPARLECVCTLLNACDLSKHVCSSCWDLCRTFGHMALFLGLFKCYLL